MRQTAYRVAGAALHVETRDAWAAEAIDHLFAGWHLGPACATAGDGPSIVFGSERAPLTIPEGLESFEVAGGGRCSVDGETSYIKIGGSVVALGKSGHAPVEVWCDGPLPLDSGALTRLVTYALSAALRQRERYELHSGALVEPHNGTGVFIVGPSGSGKSTLAVHLASAGWPYLTDDVVLLGAEEDAVSAWPLRRRFAITPRTLAASGFLQGRPSLDGENSQAGKQFFLPDDVFDGEFRDRCTPEVLLFPALTGLERTTVVALPPGESMARLMRMSPWCCYDRATAAGHLAVLSALARQTRGYRVLAGTDMLDPQRSVDIVSRCVR